MVLGEDEVSGDNPGWRLLHALEIFVIMLGKFYLEYSGGKQLGVVTAGELVCTLLALYLLHCYVKEWKTPGAYRRPKLREVVPHEAQAIRKVYSKIVFGLSLLLVLVLYGARRMI
jgi:hypothetical protein